MQKKHNNKLMALLTVITVMITFLSFGQEQEYRKPSVLQINEAIDKGLLEIEISGASDSRVFHEIIDNDGVHFGKCMAITLKSNIDTLVLLKLDAGTELIPFDSTFQTMIVTKSIELPLYPGQTYTTRAYAMCGQIHDAPPYIGSIYEVGLQADSNTVRLAQYFDEYFIQNMIGQHALWAYTDGADLKDLEKYGADSLSIALTTNILNNLSIKTTLNAEEEVEEQIEEDSLKNTIEVDVILIYISGSLLFILLISTIYLIFRRKRSNEVKV